MSEAATKVRRAIQRYEEADKILKDFMSNHDEIFGDFLRLLDTRNSTLSRAQESIRQERLNFGEFTHQVAKKVIFDIDALKNKLSNSKFKRVTVLSVDRKAVENLLEREEIKKEEIEGTFTVQESVKCFGPKPWILK